MHMNGGDRRLSEKRKIFVNSVSEDTLNNLLDDVLREKVLDQEETEKVKKENGCHASQLLIGYICKRDSTFASKLRFSSDKQLIQKRRLFIRSVGHGTINALLDDLLEDRALSQEEMCKVKDENHTVMDRARVLIDLIIGKGCHACKKFIQYLWEEDPELASKMELYFCQE
ncbi:PREDICTED: caspase recruitment domain-containing protein 18-like [Miniopterus natalensis]|uniref:caspase recruitment domain-containing protein 18-like n=1 Tax=Miniopterus natalensis TaxID=291302 RepID=UPI0007A6F4C2|nr:PREDICTED: caspase recruitment domain-containing protein 18-like [Miniopterus natalensis]